MRNKKVTEDYIWKLFQFCEIYLLIFLFKWFIHTTDIPKQIQLKSEQNNVFLENTLISKAQKKQKKQSRPKQADWIYSLVGGYNKI